MTFNSKGRVKLSVDSSCVGSYFIQSDTLDVKYDPGAKACVWGHPERFKVKEPNLEFLSVSYKRLDKKDDTSF